MNNKILFLLPLFLLFSTTQCMETTTTKSNSVIIYDIKKLLKKHDILIEEMKNYETNQNIPYHSKHCCEAILRIIPVVHTAYKTKISQRPSATEIPSIDSFFYFYNNEKKQFLPYEADQYSFLGFATMSIRHCIPHEGIPYQEKKNRIKFIQKTAFNTPTHKDQELAVVEKWKRCAPTIIKKICFWYHPTAFPELPQQLNNYIALLTFYAKFAEEESLF